MHIKPILAFLLLSMPFWGYSQNLSKQQSVQVTAKFSPQNGITLFWKDDLTATKHTVYRREYGETKWKVISSVAAPTDSLNDRSINNRKWYEYVVYRENATTTLAYGHILCRTNPTYTFSAKNAVLLVVESALWQGIKASIENYEKDLRSEGWRVKRIVLDSSTSQYTLKDSLQKHYYQDTTFSYAFLVGNLAVPYSGNLAPDGHPDHQGAWPTDGYYADLDGKWTDKTVNALNTARTANRNVPLDNKFDQSKLPSAPELVIGRLYLEKLTASAGFSSDRETRYRRYFEKLHAYKSGASKNYSDALIHNGFIDRQEDREAFSAMGYRYFPQMVQASNIYHQDPKTHLRNNTSKIAYVSGFGSYTSISKTIASDDWAKDSFEVAFIGLLGSYFADWDNFDNFLRAPLAGRNPALISFWSGRPSWYLHELAAGLPIGESFKSSMNDSMQLGQLDYHQNLRSSVHMALMGDPTLKLHYPQAVSGLKLSSNDSITVNLEWNSSSGADGYYIYRKAHPDSIFTLLNISNQVTTFTDSFPHKGKNSYWVRAYELVGEDLGGYHTLSLGAESEINGLKGVKVDRISAQAVEPDVHFYPNPVVNSATISLHNSLNNNTFEVTTFTGQRLLAGHLTNGSNNVDLTNLSNGIYVLHVWFGNGQKRSWIFQKI